MPKLPDEKELLELLEMAKVVEHQMKKIGDMITQLENKYEKRLRPVKESQISNFFKKITTKAQSEDTGESSLT
jgi:hypothetical protein